MSELQDQVRCELYKKLLDEHCIKPTRENYRQHLDYVLASGYISQGNPEHARYHLVHAGVPQEFVLTVDALVIG